MFCPSCRPVLLYHRVLRQTAPTRQWPCCLVFACIDLAMALLPCLTEAFFVFPVQLSAVSHGHGAPLPRSTA
eukprot:14590099-Alexandrium_andersonii.AAC.1